MTEPEMASWSALKSMQQAKKLLQRSERASTHFDDNFRYTEGEGDASDIESFY